jgi:hypothetical protein
MTDKFIDLEIAHRFCSNNRKALQESTTCGCFYCLSIFNPIEIKDWIDPADNTLGKTARCPCCGIDSIIASASGLPITSDFLEKMYQHWFAR